MAIFKTIIGSSSKKPDSGSEKKACLAIISGKDIGRTYNIEKAHVIIGRDDDTDVKIDDPLVSRMHALIKMENNTYKIIDQNSTNGTMVNFQHIKEATLQDSDKIMVGETIIKFIYKDSIEVDFHDEIYKLASLDGLTQIYNKKHFKELLEKELSRSKRQNASLSLCMFDIDFFKSINDKFGHQAGDYVLVTLSNKIKNLTRKEDVFARYGGEEFCVLLPDTSLQQAALFSEKIRATIETSLFIYANQKIPVTISIGIAELNNEDISGDQFIEKSDQKLYVSKQTGRNKVSY